MLDMVDVGRRSIEAYRGIVSDDLLEDLRETAARLRGVRILHLNATPFGGGVSELLRSAIPLLNDLGLVAHWRIISGDEAFFRVTKTLHNGLQGAPAVLTDAEKAVYLENARINAQAFSENYDFVFVHDPQPAALLPLHGKGHARWIWRCHIDTGEPNLEVWAFLRQFLAEYDAAIFTMEEFIPPDFPVGHVETIPPAIDPLSPKNILLPEQTARQVLDWIGVRVDRPLVTQVSRFDPWKDPLGVIQAYRKVRQGIPNLQLALVGSLALDDPEGAEIYRTIRAETMGDRLVHVFTNVIGVGNIEVNAFQTLSNLIIQKSLREGFGLVISEAMWKGTPVVAGRAGGIPLQMADGVGGLLVDSVDECADAMLELLQDPVRARSLAAKGRERVREHFLIPRLLLNELNLVLQLAERFPISRPREQRDPVCGMALEHAPICEEYGGRRYGFCSERCRHMFLEDPERHLSTPGSRILSAAPPPH